MAIAGQLWKALSDPNPQDPATQAAIAAVESHMTPDGFLQLVKLTQTNKGIFDQYARWQQDNPAWATAQRQQKFLVRYTVDGKSKLGQADNMDQAKALVKSVGGSFSSLEPNQKGSGEDFPALGPEAGDVVRRIAELEDSRLEMMKDNLSPEQYAQMKDLSVATQFAREAANTGGGLKGFEAPARLLSQGAENLPWLRNQISCAVGPSPRLPRNARTAGHSDAVKNVVRKPAPKRPADDCENQSTDIDVVHGVCPRDGDGEWDSDVVDTCA